jgi:prepilin-type N-terminal cleavage/methylation domain-containing protein
LQRHPFRSLKAFTLVELLIVVGIIALLSAIAVPNFLEAQTRAKVSRTKADLRAIATGLETYRTDYSGYPVVGNPAMPGSWDMSIAYGKRLKALTTPIAYITSIPKDVYPPQADPKKLGPEYCYAPGNFYHGGSPKYSGNIYRNTIYSVSGRGPDREINAGGYCLSHPAAFESQLNVLGQYDATNGTTSGGDIVQLSCSRL